MQLHTITIPMNEVFGEQKIRWGSMSMCVCCQCVIVRLTFCMSFFIKCIIFFVVVCLVFFCLCIMFVRGIACACVIVYLKVQLYICLCVICVCVCHSVFMYVQCVWIIVGKCMLSYNSVCRSYMSLYMLLYVTDELTFWPVK